MRIAERPTPNNDDIRPNAMNTDRRRNNAPSGGTSAPVFARTIREPEYLHSLRPSRSRKPNELRKICKLTEIVGLVPIELLLDARSY